MRQKFAAVCCAVALGVAGAVAVAVPASADPARPAGCTSARQIGNTAYMKAPNGQTVASVKQYYGMCDGAPRNWAYTWVWDSALSNPKWKIIVGYVEIATVLPGGTGYTYGSRKGSYGEQQVISAKTNTTRSCTIANAGITVYNRQTMEWLFFANANTNKVC